MWLMMMTPVLFTASLADEPTELSAPVLIHAGGEAIDIKRVGHSAPFVGDIDGDGRRDLLVGEFHEGRLRIYRNMSTNTEPRFESFTHFQAGGEIGRVPTG